VSKPILVGYDPSSVDRAPVKFGVAAARSTGAPLILGSVHADHAAVGQIGHGHLEAGLADDASEPLDQIRRELSAEGVRVECRALTGTSPPRALHRAAEEFDAGLLVAGSTTRGSIGRLLPGSTAGRLLHGAPCPVAVVPHGWEPKGRIDVLGVAYADTPEGQEALRGALALARRAGAKLRVLSAAKPHGFGKTEGGGPLREETTFEEVGSALRVAAEQGVAVATAGAQDVEIEPDVSVQDPADFLIAASDRLDLLICGSRGYGPERAVLLGGVSRRVTAEARCPVIVLARGLEAGLEALIGEPAGTGV
jgi:nucleotide-binding universal stress UspA family protein